MEKSLQASELIIEADGSIYHLRLRPEELADTVILVGDPGRVPMVSAFFDRVEVRKSNREFVTHTGSYHDKRITVISTGIGTDNIDIVLNELDALKNIDFTTREIYPQHHPLTVVRIGTSGSLQQEVPTGAFLLTRKAVGFDGLMHFYRETPRHADRTFAEILKKELDWPEIWNRPYVFDADEELAEKMSGPDVIEGITISAPGFYGPQGRMLRLSTADPAMNTKIAAFSSPRGEKITNYEMESSAVYGLSRLLGHHAVTLCAIIANRITGEAVEDYKPLMEKLILYVLNKLTA
jgi:uridine phosphorylase